MYHFFLQFWTPFFFFWQNVEPTSLWQYSQSIQEVIRATVVKPLQRMWCLWRYSWKCQWLHFCISRYIHTFTNMAFTCQLLTRWIYSASTSGRIYHIKALIQNTYYFSFFLRPLSHSSAFPFSEQDKLILHGLSCRILMDVLKNKFLLYIHIKVFTVLVKGRGLHLVSSKTLTCLLFLYDF